MAYATVAEADAYFDKKYGSKWETLDYNDKCRLLENATLNIDSFEYSGEKVDEEQDNEFPRIFCDGTLSDDNLVKKACYEEALRIYETGENSVISSSDNIKSMSLGDVDIEIESDMTASTTNTQIDNILRKYIKTDSARILL